MSNKCQEIGCRQLETRCVECRRLAVDRIVPVSQWISVKERTPKFGENVLLLSSRPWSGKHREILVGMNGHLGIDGRYQRLIGSTHCPEDLRVTHWMHIPKVPDERLD
jgi:hypothetical protein